MSQPMTAETDPLLREVARLNALERRIIDRFIHRERLAADAASEKESVGDRFADRVTSFGGSWPFIVLTLVAIGTWMVINATMSKAFDAYPFILLNLVLACMTLLQAPLIMSGRKR